MKKKISFILPVFNEEKNISLFYQKLRSVLDTVTYTYELIFIDDGSTDDSWLHLKTLALHDPEIKAIRFSKNFGHQIALSAGYDHAMGDAIITMDTDLQHPPSTVSHLIKAWEGGSSIVYARRINTNVSLFKRITAFLYYKLLRTITTIDITLNVADFRLIDKKGLNIIKRYKGKSRYMRGIIAWPEFPSSYVDFYCQKRHAGTTGYSIKKMMQLALDGIITFSTIPLHFASITTICMILFIPIFIFLSHFWMLTILYIFITLLFLQLSIIGIYLGSLQQGQLNLPLYVILESIRIKPKNID